MRKVEDGLQAAGATTAEKRTARFVAVMCLAFPDGATETWRGEVEGRLVWPPRGKNGFGYDPMFVPREQGGGDDRTFGEMSADEKHALSHRARAFAAFARARLG
jgi:XTP/dITP diphosphohydrolase